MIFKKIVAMLSVCFLLICMPIVAHAADNNRVIYIPTGDGQLQIIESDEDYQISIENNVITVKSVKKHSAIEMAILRIRTFWKVHYLTINLPTADATSDDFPQSIYYEEGESTEPNYVEGTLYLESYKKLPEGASIWRVKYSGYCTLWD